MSLRLLVRNESDRTHLYRRDVLQRLSERILDGEDVHGDLEVSLLLCDDPFIAELNQSYRDTKGPTDVLSFEQEAPAAGPRVLGDIVVSLETVERNCGGDRALMREEVRLLVCHGLLHLLGYDHGTARERERMCAKQAEYLGVSNQDAWRFGPKQAARNTGTTQRARRGGTPGIGR